MKADKGEGLLELKKRVGTGSQNRSPSVYG